MLLSPFPALPNLDLPAFTSCTTNTGCRGCSEVGAGTGVKPMLGTVTRAREEAWTSVQPP